MSKLPNFVPRAFGLVDEVDSGNSVITAQGPQDPGDEVGSCPFILYFSVQANRNLLFFTTDQVTMATICITYTDRLTCKQGRLHYKTIN